MMQKNVFTEQDQTLRLWGESGRERSMRSLGEHVHTTMYDQQGPAVQWRELRSGLCNDPHGGEGERRAETTNTYITASLHCTPQTNNTAGQLLSLSCVRSAAPGRQAPGSSARHCLLARLKLTSIQSVMPSNHLCSIIKYFKKSNNMFELTQEIQHTVLTSYQLKES